MSFPLNRKSNKKNQKNIRRNTSKSLASRRRSLQEGDGVEIEGEEATGPPPPPKPSKLGRDCSQGFPSFKTIFHFLFSLFVFFFVFLHEKKENPKKILFSFLFSLKILVFSLLVIKLRSQAILRFSAF